MTRRRKRGRSASDDGDGDQSVPISKRINRLQIGISSEECGPQNGSMQCDNGPGNHLAYGASPSQQYSSHPQLSPQQNPMLQQIQHSPHDIQSSPNLQNSTLIHSPQHLHSPGNAALSPHFPTPVQHQTEAQRQQQYEPELTANDNPHYYHINQVLYKANWERLQRNNLGSGFQQT